jgi:hypothetical protein
MGTIFIMVVVTQLVLSLIKPKTSKHNDAYVQQKESTEILITTALIVVMGVKYVQTVIAV